MTENTNLYPLWVAEDYMVEATHEASMEDWEEAYRVLCGQLKFRVSWGDEEEKGLVNECLRLALEDAIDRIAIEIDRMREQDEERTREARPTEFGRFLFEKMEREGVRSLEDLTIRAKWPGFSVNEGAIRRAVYKEDELYEGLTDRAWAPALSYVLRLSEEEVQEMVGFVVKRWLQPRA